MRSIFFHFVSKYCEMLNPNQEYSITVLNRGKAKLIKRLKLVPVGSFNTIQPLIHLREPTSLWWGGGQNQAIYGKGKKRAEVYCFALVLKFPKLICWIRKHDVCARNLDQFDSWWLRISRGLKKIPKFSANSTPHKHSSDLLSTGAACSMLVTTWAHNWKKDSASCFTH